MYGTPRPSEKDHGGPSHRSAARARYCAGAPPPPAAPPGADATLDAQQVIGWRIFAKELNKPFLTSPYQGDEWRAGEATASYINDDEGGLYAHHSRAWLEEYEDWPAGSFDHVCWDPGKRARWLVPAIVGARGEMFVYKGGFRAEHMRILAVGTFPGWSRRFARTWKAWMTGRYGAVVIDPLSSAWTVRWGARVPYEFYPDESCSHDYDNF